MEEALLQVGSTRALVSSTNRLPFREYWDWFAMALFLLITLDMISSRYAAVAAGHASEANPIMRWVLQQDVVVLTTVNLLAGFIAVGSFYFLMALLDSTHPPYDRYLAWLIEIWLGVLIAGGLFVFANNIAVIVHGRSLIGFS